MDRENNERIKMYNKKKGQLINTKYLFIDEKQKYL